ncbi:Rieske [2Fe-2S] iron-sulfur domain-containing protein [Ampelomyces quisqualis]|uniref:Choline monooxygenase, chloroplastic n=1 Tax=Ampelomyces quisqualis TaxID=50730 RepID=A0A6A5R373_AMPQU|nr:Rieske [2Fe-2S] iron-sulfur domain-containing protein [Ampelomyces quisqualis]
MAYCRNYIGLGGSSDPAPPSKNEAVRALPANWYTSEEMYQLERRAIFSRRWLLLTHKSRLLSPGDYLRYSIANYDIVVSKDRQGEIHAFHNVCRHRAYPVVEQDEGNARIFSCKYHGWSYGLNGKLAKAPGYQDLEGFEKAENGLFPIHVRLDRNGYIWINMDSNPVPEVSWESQFDTVDEQERLNDFNFDDYVFDHTYSMESNFNWKILADNFNECYHCKTTHPDLPAIANLETYDVHCAADHIQHDPKTTDAQRAAGFGICSTYMFPNVSFTVTSTFMMMQKFLPKAPGVSIMSYEVWRHKDAPRPAFDSIANLYARVMKEDKVLCERAQANLNAGLFVNGELHPRLEKGPLFFQQRCRAVVGEWAAREKRARAHIWPARQRVGAASVRDVAFCEGLGCARDDDDKGELDW